MVERQTATVMDILREKKLIECFPMTIDNFSKLFHQKDSKRSVMVKLDKFSIHL